MEEEAARKRKMPWAPQAGPELRRESPEDKSPRETLVGEAVLKGSPAQEGSGEEKGRRSPRRRGSKASPGCSEEERASLCREGGRSLRGSSELVVPEQPPSRGKPFRCLECGKSFRNNSHLMEHHLCAAAAGAMRSLLFLAVQGERLRQEKFSQSMCTQPWNRALEIFDPYTG
ncbi:zinc finger protein 3-like [Manacus candei]|uniref:zinc finger protein 3-like n=1 Tax=Manacus candei TaxID=415023 RepID=UPI002225F3C4|nr:zinc finger protein 3-like [Manacus candei]